MNLSAGIYLHIPFCKKRCIYCDFYSTTRSDMREIYTDALCMELAMRKDYLDGADIATVYIGGGTPSQLGEGDFSRIFSTIEAHYRILDNAEITIEVNPDDITDEYIGMLRRFPFNRISMGVQTFDDNLLSLLNRRHTASQAVEAYQRCRKAGFRNISLDLMYGLPGETLEGWTNDLDKIIELKPEHISAYHLIYEEDTELWRMKERSVVTEADEELSIEFFTLLKDRLAAAGYEHYEISNFCKPGYHSRHNSSYWTGRKYLGCGASAHSYNGESRQWNVSSLDKYIDGIQCGNPDIEHECLDIYTQYNDFVITSMRTSWGMPLNVLKEKFGTELYDYCMRMSAPAIREGLAETDGNVMRLTRKGIFVSDDIMSDMLWVE